MEFKIINWNVGGAKFLELPSNPLWENPPKINQLIASQPILCREEFRWRLKEAFDTLLREQPDVVTLQEVVQYNENDNETNPTDLLDKDYFSKYGYNFHFFKMIDTITHSARGKWNNIINAETNGKKHWIGDPYFAQGNAILVRHDLNLFPVWSIPHLNVDYAKYVSAKHMGNRSVSHTNASCEICFASEIVYVEQGLYLGNRDTEPRAAIVTHLVVSDNLERTRNISLNKPLDIFIVNLHLTTITNEREGIPFVDEKATKIRLKQLDIIFNDIISRYNSWRQIDEYKLRGSQYPTIENIETTKRHKPLWILAGDFNFMPNSYEYEYIINRKFIDLIRNSIDRKGTKANKLGKEPTHTLDYTFAGPLYDSISPREVAEVYVRNSSKTSFSHKVSDHYPIVINIPVTLEEE